MATLTADHLTDEQIEALGAELDALRDEVVATWASATPATSTR